MISIEDIDATYLTQEGVSTERFIPTGQVSFRIKYIQGTFPVKTNDNLVPEFMEEFNKLIGFDMVTEEFVVLTKEVTYDEHISRHTGYKHMSFNAKFDVMCNCDPMKYHEFFSEIFEREGFEVMKMPF